MEPAEFNKPDQTRATLMLLSVAQLAQNSYSQEIRNRAVVVQNGTTGLLHYTNGQDNYLNKTIPGDGGTLAEVYVLSLSTDLRRAAGIPDNIQFFTTFID